MPLKDLVVFIDAKPASERRAELAARLARAHDARLTGVHVMSRPELPGYMHGTTHAKLFQALEESANERAAAAQRTFEGAMAREGVSAEWRVARVAQIQDGIMQARYADLAIIGQIDPDDHSQFVPEIAPEDMILNAGRPVLVVPHSGRFATLGERVIVAWNAGREAARAVNDALPLLAKAKAVTVLSVNPVTGASQHGDVPGADIAVHLARHGVSVTVEKTHTKELDPADVLLNRITDLGADLLVTGGYGRSRTRELILGGVTRDLLRRMTVPVLMSH